MDHVRNPNEPRTPLKDFELITPDDIESVLKSRGCHKATVHEDHSVYVLPGAGVSFLVVSYQAHPYYARSIVHLVEKLLEVFGPRAVYDVWSCVARRAELDRRWEEA